MSSTNMELTLFFSVLFLINTLSKRKYKCNKLKIYKTHVSIYFMLIIIFILTQINERNVESTRYLQTKHTNSKKNPYQALLLIENLENENKICGGTLITTKHILTAAHCIYHNPLCKLEQITFGFDIGLVVLSKSLSLNDDINLICIPSSVETNQKYIGKLAKLSSFVLSKNKTKTTTVMIISNDLCSLYYGSKSHINDFHLCAYGNKGSSYGDSGSAIVHKGVQIGIVSMSDENNLKYAPSVYTRIDKYLDWIRHNTIDDL